MTGAAGGRAGQRRQTVGWLRERVVVVEARCQAVVAERDRLAGEVERLRAANQRLVARVGELVAKVEELRRAGKRQTAPFPRNRPARSPRRPGRKAGAAYGRHARRPIPSGSTGSWWWGCRTPALAAAASFGWSGSPASIRKTFPYRRPA